MLSGGGAALSSEQVSQPSDHQGLPLCQGAQEPGGDGRGTKVHLQGSEQRLQVGVCTSFKQSTSPVWNSSDESVLGTKALSSQMPSLLCGL